MKKIAIFDLDGTILNTIEDLSDAGNEICRRHGFPLHSIDEYRFFVGNGIPKLVHRFVPEGTDPETEAECLKEFIEFYKDHSDIKTRPYEGLTEVLKKLKEEQFLLAVNSNKVENASVALCAEYFPQIFDIVIGNKEGLPVKPAPDGVYEILNKVGISLQDARNGAAVFIGDSDVDIQTGVNAGIAAIGVDWGFRGEAFLKAHGADIVAKDPEDLLRSIKNVVL